eukprot:TRINITY_DN3725_c0_g2_i1.p1 TRINITY_DN3725_c0_g2~~TRINITY_DN3725_c0_g2_i1.p1  ORF type:complete len:376 (+),score=117.55 TRINITY_DN3725_c0_g2_i1:73-1200(+)
MEDSSSEHTENGNDQNNMGNAVREFLREAAISTRNGVTLIRQRLQYAAKQHRVIDDFKHDDEIYQCIRILKKITRQSKSLSRVSNMWMQREKDYSVAETRHASRMRRLSQEFEPLQMEELLLSYAEGLAKLAEFHCEHLTQIANDFTRPIDGFYRTNVKQTRSKKIECNMQAMLRENHAKAYENKVEAENKKEPEKRDKPALRLAEEKKEDAENQYDLISGELLMLVDSLELKQRLELPVQFLAYLNAQESFYQNCYETVVQLKQKLAPLVQELQSEEFQPKYRVDAPKAPIQQRHDFEEEHSAEASDESEDDDNDDHQTRRKFRPAPPLPPPPSNMDIPPLPPKANTTTAPPLPSKPSANNQRDQDSDVSIDLD